MLPTRNRHVQSTDADASRCLLNPSVSLDAAAPFRDAGCAARHVTRPRCVPREAHGSLPPNVASDTEPASQPTYAVLSSAKSAQDTATFNSRFSRGRSKFPGAHRQQTPSLDPVKTVPSSHTDNAQIDDACGAWRSKGDLPTHVCVLPSKSSSWPDAAPPNTSEGCRGSQAMEVTPASHLN